MNAETSRILNMVQLVVEICVGAGFLLGLVPFAYLYSSGWVVPLTIVSLILSIVNRPNSTLLFTITNVCLAFISYIPILGFLTRLAGACISLFIIINLKNKLRF